MKQLQKTIENEYRWFEQLVHLRCKEVKGTNIDAASLSDLISEQSLEAEDVYSKICRSENWEINDRIIVLLALSVYLKPSLVQKLLQTYQLLKEHQGGLNTLAKQPTLEHALFLIYGNNEQERSVSMKYLEDDYPLFLNRILEKKYKEDGRENEEAFSKTLNVTEEFRRQIASGELYEPDYSSSFPAKKIVTEYGWKDLVLDKKVADQVQIMANWVKNLEQIKTYSSLKKGIHGYSAILYGPPGTGKSMTVKVLGKELGKVVYRIDLSQVVSKYVGETEKNLGRIFDLAKDRDWILFFDEGDALFGKRSSSKSSQDKYANQEVAYLLQRMEEHQGVILLATNKMGNIDEAFLRRFQTQIYFPNPDENLRLFLWQQAYSEEFKLEDPNVLQGIAEKYNVSPAQIINVKHHSIVKTLSQGKKLVSSEYLLEGLSLELQKNNKTL